MSIRKRNEYLDPDFSDDEESAGYNSELAEQSRSAGLASHISKRRKLSTSASDAEEGEEEDDDDDDKDDNTQSQDDVPAANDATHSTSNRIDSTKNAPKPESISTGLPPDLKTASPKQKEKKRSKPGVIYLSRIPPYMPPHTVRHHLSTHGPITNLFLTPEPPSHRAARLKAGGNKKRSYINGWIEFAHRRHAKACAEAINGNCVGGKKGGWYRDDVWNCKYLKGFGWGDLMEGVRREEREREERVRVGVARDKREREAFLRDLEGSKIEETRRRKREGKREEVGGIDDVGSGEVAQVKGKGKAETSVPKWEQRRFRQSDVKGQATLKKAPEQPDEVRRVLSKIF